MIQDWVVVREVVVSVNWWRTVTLFHKLLNKGNGFCLIQDTKLFVNYATRKRSEQFLFKNSISAVTETVEEGKSGPGNMHNLSPIGRAA